MSKAQLFVILSATFVSALILSCQHTSLVRTERRPSGEYTPDIPSNQILSFEKLASVSKANTTIAGTLKELRATYPEYLKIHSSMYESQSIQDASFSEPRIIVFGPEAKFVFTFNGNDGQKGGNVIETAEYDETHGQFLFREIIFKKEKPYHATDLIDESEVEYETDNVIVSKTNPELCMECHGFIVTRPIWANYFIWPGAYGSNDDLVYDAKSPDHGYIRGAWYLDKLSFPRSQGRGIDLKPGVPDKEQLGYEEYQKSAKTHPRYQWLPPHEEAARGLSLSQMFAARSNGLLQYDFEHLQMENLEQELARMQIKKRWADVVLPPARYQGEPTQGHVSPFDLDKFVAPFEKAFGSARVQRLLSKYGPLREFVAKSLLAELDMQADKIRRMEKTFGDSAFESDHQTYPANNQRLLAFYGGDNFMGISLNTYEQLKGKPLNKYEQLGYRLEGSNSLAYNIVLAYFLKGEGLSLEDYDINRDDEKPHDRILSFHVLDYLPELFK